MRFLALGLAELVLGIRWIVVMHVRADFLFYKGKIVETALLDQRFILRFRLSGKGG